MSEKLRNQNLYAPHGRQFDAGVAYHNIGDLLELHPDRAAEVNAKYGQRFGHLPVGGQIEGILLGDSKSAHSEETAVLLAKGAENARKQAKYIGALSGHTDRFTILTPQELRVQADGGTKVLIAPYLNNGKLANFRAEQGLDGPNIEVSGMHHDVVAELKNKATFHEKVKKERNPDFAVPHHEVVNIQDIAQTGKELFAFEEELYEAIGMPDYQRGIFGRLNYSDGGFGSFNIKQNNRKEYVLEADDHVEREPYASVGEALKEAQAFMIQGSGNNLDAEVVLSRALDLVDVPGLSMHFMDGDVLPLGFNAQILEPKTKACIGTSTYEPTRLHVVRTKDEYEARVVNGAKTFVHDLALQKGIPIEELHGFINVDVMILGEAERLVQHKITEGLKNGTFDQSLRDKLERYGQLTEPADYFLAESNPRRTNMIEAIDEVMLVEGMPQTLASMQKVMENGIRAEDYLDLPSGIDVDDLEEALGERYGKDVRSDGLVIMRTRPIEVPKDGESSTIGVILTGDLTKRKAELHDIFQDVKAA